MRIAFNARMLRDGNTRGWNRYAVNLLSELEAMGFEVFLYAQGPIHASHRARLPRAQVRVGPAVRYPLWQEIWLPRQCAVDRIDVLHSPFNFGLPFISPCPRVLTLHDAIFASADASREVAPSARGAAARFLHWEARTRAHHIITVSEHAKGDLTRGLAIPAERISVVPEAADPIFLEAVPDARRKEARAEFDLRRPYVFYAGGFDERKNVGFLLEAFDRADLGETELVVCGGDPAGAERLQATARGAGVGGRLRILGWVPDRLLPALYAEALCFVYPSRHEGFGLQLCEAMAVGCPVLAARATSLPEVLGDGGVTFSLAGTEELSGLLRRVASESAWRKDLSSKARRRGAAFSWRRAAEQTVAVYRRCLAS